MNSCKQRECLILAIGIGISNRNRCLFDLASCRLAECLVVARCEVHRYNPAAQDILDIFRKDVYHLFIHRFCHSDIVSIHRDEFPNVCVWQELPPGSTGVAGYAVMKVDDTKCDGDDFGE